MSDIVDVDGGQVTEYRVVILVARGFLHPIGSLVEWKLVARPHQGVRETVSDGADSLGNFNSINANYGHRQKDTQCKVKSRQTLTKFRKSHGTKYLRDGVADWPVQVVWGAAGDWVPVCPTIAPCCLDSRLTGTIVSAAPSPLPGTQPIWINTLHYTLLCVYMNVCVYILVYVCIWMCVCISWYMCVYECVCVYCNSICLAHNTHAGLSPYLLDLQYFPQLVKCIPHIWLPLYLLSNQ